VKPWWEERPDRFQYEVDELQQAGARSLDIKKNTEAGLLQITFNWGLNGAETRFTVEYPPTYPYTRFEIFAPELDLPHHQNPLLKNLCVLARRSENWDIDYTPASFLRDRVPQVLIAGYAADAESAAGLEVQQAEPASTYLPFADNSVVMIGPNFSVPPNIRAGTFQLGIEMVSAKNLRGAVLEFRADDDSVIYTAPQHIKRLYQTTHVFMWTRIETLPICPPKSFEAILATKKEIGTPRWTYIHSVPLDIHGMVAPEEASWRKSGETFICLVRVRVDRNGFRPGKHWETFMARPDRLPTISNAVRAPELAALGEKKIAIVGAGCLGAAAALEFTRAGVREIKIIDYDVVEAPSTIRWPLGLSAAGREKTLALADFIKANYPNTIIHAVPRKYGTVVALGGANASEIENLFSDVHLIYDATAEEGISYPLSEHARRRRCIYIAVYGLSGAWGGRVIRLRPDLTTGCWMCFKLTVQNGAFPTPPSDPTMVQPVGCAEPTFTGANFDMQHVTLVGVRAAVLSLVQGHASAPKDMTDDVFTLSLRTAEGSPITPSWTSSPLLQHSQCPNH
jgi:molybdopterin/thiamine biosynthesis adenylyltransferase